MIYQIKLTVPQVAMLSSLVQKTDETDAQLLTRALKMGLAALYRGTRRGPVVPSEALIDRDKAICLEWASGTDAETTAKKYGLSIARVYQIRKANKVQHSLDAMQDSNPPEVTRMPMPQLSPVPLAPDVADDSDVWDEVLVGFNG